MCESSVFIGFSCVLCLQVDVWQLFSVLDTFKSNVYRFWTGKQKETEKQKLWPREVRILTILVSQPLADGV